MNLSDFTIDHFVNRNIIKEFECPICYSIMFKVCELDNCGHLLCKKCVKKIKDCPICKNRNVYYHTSKYLQRKLYDQEVKCTIPKCNKIFTFSTHFQE